MVICGDIEAGLAGTTETIHDFSSLSRMVALGLEMTNVAAITVAKIKMPSGIKIRVSNGLWSINAIDSTQVNKVIFRWLILLPVRKAICSSNLDINRYMDRQGCPLFNFFVVFGKYSITCHCESGEINAHMLMINAHYHEQNTGESGIVRDN